MTIRTVGDLVAELLKQPQDLPVLVGCHYDNDDGLTDRVGVGRIYAQQSEGEFHYQGDPGDPGGFWAVAVQ